MTLLVLRLRLRGVSGGVHLRGLSSGVHLRALLTLLVHQRRPMIHRVLRLWLLETEPATDAAPEFLPACILGVRVGSRDIPRVG